MSDLEQGGDWEFSWDDDLTPEMELFIARNGDTAMQLHLLCVPHVSYIALEALSKSGTAQVAVAAYKEIAHRRSALPSHTLPIPIVKPSLRERATAALRRFAGRS